MKIVKIIGGLGNQMFQYAFYLAIKKSCKSEKVLIDLHCFNGYKLHYGFEIYEIFGFPKTLPCASLLEVAKIAYPYPNFKTWKYGKHILPARPTMFVENKHMQYEENCLTSTLDKNCYYDGYWQNEKYFENIKDEIIKTFKFPELDQENMQLGKQLQSCVSVSMHVRRGDYLTDPLFRGTCKLEYYKKAIKYIEEKVSPELFCIFSNDIEWCKQEITPLINSAKIKFVTWNKGKESFRDMQLMSLCKHNIIANSSFSWWGAWLNRNKSKIVIAPQLWYAKDKYESPVCQSWHKL